MKRTIVFLLSALLALNLAACGKSQNADEPAPVSDPAASDSADVVVAEAGGTVATQRADSDVAGYEDLDELNEASGAHMARPISVSAEGEVFETLEENGVKIAQYVFLTDGIPCGLRYCADPSADISGVQTGDGLPAFDGANGDVIAVDGNSYGRWNTSDGQYVLVVGSDNNELFTLLFEEMQQLIPE